MKANDLRDLTVEELLKKKKDAKEEVFNLRFQHSTGQLDNVARMKIVRRDVARIETIIREKELKNRG
ncbi:MAG TPA: 50S ribosomal protein L29 [Syntrophorhabdaceae bacterium]|jgi:large subunit ribosomal protein L29|nr:50S ribosomal protein L29 [Syntrophorhabdaceae bacterium]MDI9560679.1 50S ribosomal protein L29 [Pseudomonadota bacterium]OQC50936.1 MAG: 50S ribosomal protein L29 [Deltaproteobacteria bacterium ADurb.Bin026]MBP8699338.1 50S ribosomal protein L29 [Syntrophorhabdaceae bacterium]HNZ59464.1 50S ribosomal protein L29 [Syntrophorhabdaceae bacterium]